MLAWICAAATVVMALMPHSDLLSQPATFTFAEVQGGGDSIRLVNRSTDGTESVDPRFDGMVWQPFGLRLHSDTDPRSSGGVREVRGSLARLDVRGEYQIFSFRTQDSEVSRIAFVGSGGPDLLLGSSDDRYRLIEGGASLGPDGHWLGLVVHGHDTEEVVIIELTEGSPSARVITLPDHLDKVDEESLTLTSSFAYLAARTKGDSRVVLRIVLQEELQEVGDASASIETIAGPFEEVCRYMASSRTAVAFLAGSQRDSLDVFVARDAETIVNVTQEPDEYLDHRPGEPHLAVSDSGEFVSYNLEMGGEPELFLHRVATPGSAGREQITSDRDFNPYIDQESFVFLARDTLIFAAGHDDQSADVFAVDGVLGEQTINFTLTGSDRRPFFRTTGTLFVHELFQVDDDRTLVAASGYSDGPATSLRLYETLGGELLDEVGISAVAIQITLAGGSLYLTAREADAAWVLYRVDGDSLNTVARSLSGPIRLLLQREDAAYYAVEGIGLLEVSSDPEARVVVDAEHVGSVVSLRSISNGLVAVLQSPEGATLVNVNVNEAGGTMQPLSVLARGSLLAARGLPDEAFVRGDANASGAVDIADPVAILFYLFLGFVDLACLDAADANDDGVIEIADVVYGLSALFLGGPAFPPPYPFPGIDPTSDALICPTTN